VRPMADEGTSSCSTGSAGSENADAVADSPASPASTGISDTTNAAVAIRLQVIATFPTTDMASSSLQAPTCDERYLESDSQQARLTATWQLLLKQQE
jgi:hypothetical protein